MMLSIPIIEVLIRKVLMVIQNVGHKKMSLSTFQMYGCVLRITLTATEWQKKKKSFIGTMICSLYIVTMYCGDIFHLTITTISLSDLFMLVTSNHEDLLKTKISTLAKDFFLLF